MICMALFLGGIVLGFVIGLMLGATFGPMARPPL